MSCGRLGSEATSWLVSYGQGIFYGCLRCNVSVILYTSCFLTIVWWSLGDPSSTSRSCRLPDVCEDLNSIPSYRRKLQNLKYPFICITRLRSYYQEIYSYLQQWKSIRGRRQATWECMCEIITGKLCWWGWLQRKGWETYSQSSLFVYSIFANSLIREFFLKSNFLTLQRLDVFLHKQDTVESETNNTTPIIIRNVTLHARVSAL